jgi:hypothetical protein
MREYGWERRFWTYDTLSCILMEDTSAEGDALAVAQARGGFAEEEALGLIFQVGLQAAAVASDGKDQVLTGHWGIRAEPAAGQPPWPMAAGSQLLACRC